MKRKVYRASFPVSIGGKFFLVENKKEAINLTGLMNKKARKKDWVWG